MGVFWRDTRCCWVHAEIMHKLEKTVWLKLYIDPIKLLHILDDDLLFLVLYEFSVFIMHKLVHCKFVAQKYCNKILLYSIGNFWRYIRRSFVVAPYILKLGKIVKFKTYVYPIKMLHIHDDNLLFVVLYGF